MEMSWPDYAEREGRESGGSMYLAHDVLLRLSRDKARWLQRESDARRDSERQASCRQFPLRGGAATPSRDSTHGRPPPLFFRSFNPPPLDSFCGTRAENGTNDTRDKRVLSLERGFQSATFTLSPPTLQSPSSIHFFFFFPWRKRTRIYVFPQFMGRF